MKTAQEKLVEALKELLIEVEQGQFHDFESEKYATPKIELVQKLQRIIEEVKRGTYDD